MNSLHIQGDIIEGLQDKWLSQSRGYATYNSVYGEVKIPWIEGLKYRATLGLDFMQDNDGNYTAEGIGSNNATTNQLLLSIISHNYHWNIQNLLSYDHVFGR